MNQAIPDRVSELAPGSVLSSVEYRGELTMMVKPGDIVRVCETLKSDPSLAFDMVIDITAVDRALPQERFEVVYHLYSLQYKRYVRLKVRVEEQHPVVPTVTGVWAGANWHERETFDMFGIRFSGHPDLRRLYMPEEFEYYPLRKDFPLMGIPDSLPLPRR
jgi:NADH-quinone oxidoreductase subunit C